MDNIQLFEHYSIAEVNAEEWEAFFSKHQAAVFPDEHSLSFDAILSAEEKEKIGALRENLAKSLTFYFLIFEHDKPIGWHFGFQRSELEYFMANTGILPEYQNRKIYTAFLKYLTGRIVDEGFQFITSIHHCDNNAVLIPKLKAEFMIQSLGFLIQTMILESNYGTMIQLVYPAKEIYRKVMGFKLGAKALNEEMNAIVEKK
jgi:hypothetical protein